jgi:hypothetical protein
MIKDITFAFAVFFFSFKLSRELINDASESLDFSIKKFSIKESESSRLWKRLALLSLVGVGRTIVLLKSLAMLFLGMPVLTLVMLAYKYYKEMGYRKALIADSILFIAVISSAIVNLII